MSSVNNNNQVSASADIYAAGVSDTSDQPVSLDSQIAAIKSEIPLMLDDISQQMSDLQARLDVAQEAYDKLDPNSDEAKNLAKQIADGQQALADLSADALLLNSVLDQLTNADTSDDAAAVNTFYQYQQEHSASAYIF